MEKILTEIDKNLPVKFTETAFKEIKRLAELEGDSKVLHIGVKNGGCSGFSYVFEFIDKENTFKAYNIEDLPFVINQLDLSHIKDIEIDYEQGLNNRGFTFNNPNASTTCGCGTSFA